MLLNIAGMMPQGSAPLVNAYRNANGIILGKMRMHELSAGATSISPTTANFTAVLNPYNVTHHPGGVHPPSNHLLHTLEQSWLIQCSIIPQWKYGWVLIIQWPFCLGSACKHLMALWDYWSMSLGDASTVPIPCGSKAGSLVNGILTLDCILDCLLV